MTNRNGKITNKTAAELLEIAKKYSYEVEKRGDLDPRMRDSEDFIEIYVGAIENIMRQAYLLGIRDAAKK